MKPGGRSKTISKAGRGRPVRVRDRAELLWNLAEVMLVVLDAEGRLVQINRKGCAVLGYSEVELTGRDWFDTCVPPGCRSAVKNVFRQLMAGDVESPEYFKNVLITKAGECRVVAFHNTVIRDEKHCIVGTLSSGEDITERERVEEELLLHQKNLEELVQARTAELEAANASLRQEIVERKSVEQRLAETTELNRTMIAASPIGISAYRASGTCVFANEAMARIINATREQVMGLDFHQFRSWQQSGLLRLALDALESRQPREGEFHTVSSCGREVWLGCRVVPFVSGGEAHLLLLVNDIGERRKAEQALHAESDFRRAVVERMAEGLCVCHAIPEFPHVRFTVWNERMTRITGYTMEEINGRGWYQSLYPDPLVQARARERMDRMRAGEDLLREDWEVTRADGAQRTLSISTSTFRSEDGQPHVLAVMEDVTDRKRSADALRRAHDELEMRVHERTAELARLNVEIREEMAVRRRVEQELLESRRILRTVLDRIPVRVFWKDRSLRYLGCNQPFAQDTQMESPADVVGRTDYDLFLHTNAEQYRADDTELIQTGQAKLSYEESLDVPGRRGFWIRTSKVPLVDAEGRVQGVLGSYEDITERKHTEEALRRSEEKYRSLIETTDTGYVIVDGTGHVLDANPNYVALTGYQTLSEILGRSVIEWTAPEDVEKNTRAVRQCFEERSVRNLEIRYVDRTGGTIPIEINATLVEADHGAQIVALCRDITARKQAEARIQAALEEKSVLLREVHHRVKNNLQALMHLMELKRKQVPQEPAGIFLAELEEQARAMALVYEQLFQSGSLSRIDMGPYLRHIGESLLQAFAGHREISLAIAADGVLLDVDVATPCGLISNELMTNALKHAFPPGRFETGKIDVRLEIVGKECVLTVSDDGTGLPDGLDWRKSNSLGLKLMHFWATHQMGGRLEVECGCGTTFRITFPRTRGKE